MSDEPTVPIHDPRYRECLLAAKRDFLALTPELNKLQRTVNALRNLIHAISILLNEDVEEEFEYPYNLTKRMDSGSPPLRHRPTGRPSRETHHEPR